MAATLLVRSRTRNVSCLTSRATASTALLWDWMSPTATSSRLETAWSRALCAADSDDMVEVMAPTAWVHSTAARRTSCMSVTTVGMVPVSVSKDCASCPTYAACTLGPLVTACNKRGEN